MKIITAIYRLATQMFKVIENDPVEAHKQNEQLLSGQDSHTLEWVTVASRGRSPHRATDDTEDWFGCRLMDMAKPALDRTVTEIQLRMSQLVSTDLMAREICTRAGRRNWFFSMRCNKEITTSDDDCGVIWSVRWWLRFTWRLHYRVTLSRHWRSVFSNPLLQHRDHK